MDVTRLKKLENLGYYTLPPRHEHCLGYTGLLILMRHEPIARQVAFDPRIIHLRLLDWDGKAHLTTFKNTTGSSAPVRLPFKIGPGSIFPSSFSAAPWKLTMKLPTKKYTRCILLLPF